MKQGDLCLVFKSPDVRYYGKVLRFNRPIGSGILCEMYSFETKNIYLWLTRNYQRLGPPSPLLLSLFGISDE